MPRACVVALRCPQGAVLISWLATAVGFPNPEYGTLPRTMPLRPNPWPGRTEPANPFTKKERRRSCTLVRCSRLLLSAHRPNWATQSGWFAIWPGAYMSAAVGSPVPSCLPDCGVRHKPGWDRFPPSGLLRQVCVSVSCAGILCIWCLAYLH